MKTNIKELYEEACEERNPLDEQYEEGCLCPLRQGKLCYGLNCAFWNEDYDKCSVHVIGQGITEIQYKLKGIK